MDYSTEFGEGLLWISVPALTAWTSCGITPLNAYRLPRQIPDETPTDKGNSGCRLLRQENVRKMALCGIKAEQYWQAYRHAYLRPRVSLFPSLPLSPLFHARPRLSPLIFHSLLSRPYLLRPWILSSTLSPNLRTGEQPWILSTLNSRSTAPRCHQSLRLIQLVLHNQVPETEFDFGPFLQYDDKHEGTDLTSASNSISPPGEVEVTAPTPAENDNPSRNDNYHGDTHNDHPSAVLDSPAEIVQVLSDLEPSSQSPDPRPSAEAPRVEEFDGDTPCADSRGTRLREYIGTICKPEDASTFVHFVPAYFAFSRAQRSRRRRLRTG
jgi:hypothetical protein